MTLKLVSLLGLVVFIGLAWLCSLHRRQFPWRTVLWGLGIQWLLAVIMIKTPVGAGFFELAHHVVLKVNDFAMQGAQFVFGGLANEEALQQSWGPQNATVLAVRITATIILVSSLSALFYHWGILQRIVRAMALIMQWLMRTSGSETLAAAANVFMGQTEAPLLIRPYLAKMTQSELLCLMTTGMATIAGGVLAIYASFGASSGHLVTASVLSAPAALLVAKIMLPELEKSETAFDAPARLGREHANSMDALCRGAAEGMFLSINVAAMLIAFVALVAMANFTLAFLFQTDLQLQDILGWINAPFAWLMGIPAQDCIVVGQALGERIVLNEFIGYLTLTGNRTGLEERSFIIATYALCGFANFGSVAIQIGGIGGLVPERRGDLARLGIRAMIGGILASYLTATIVGVLL